MNQKEKLIELIIESVDGCARNWAETIADHLLANGVIVPPCKVGDKVYISNGYFAPARVTAIYVDGEGGMFDLDVRSDIETSTGFKHYICKDYTFEDFGKTVFRTRGEAKRKLVERNHEEKE